MNTSTWISPNDVVHTLLGASCVTCGRSHAARLEHVRTDALRPGDRVTLPNGLERTVSHITPSEYLNRDNEPIVTVWYLEGRTPAWSAGNTATNSTMWRVTR